jgi:Flp pilus assembly pilin Flp
MKESFKKNMALLVASIGGLWRDESGQDLIEYTLLMAFVALSSAALFIGAGKSVSKIWSTSNSTLSVAATTAAS